MQDFSSHVGIGSSSHDLFGDFRIIRFILCSGTCTKSIMLVASGENGVKTFVFILDNDFCVLMSFLIPSTFMMKKLLKY